MRRGLTVSSSLSPTKGLAQSSACSVDTSLITVEGCVLSKWQFQVPVQRFPQAFAALILAISLSGCVTVNMAGSDTIDDLSRAQQQMRERAVKLSNTVWHTVASASFFDSITGMLINGREAPEGPGLVADPQGRYSTAVAYIEQTEQQHISTDEQLNAIVADVRQKTAETRDLVEATQMVVLGYRDAPGSEHVAAPTSATIVAGLADIKADMQIVDQSIASARKQQSTFQIAEQTYREKNPSADTSPITLELNSFGRQIAMMVALSRELDQVELG